MARRKFVRFVMGAALAAPVLLCLALWLAWTAWRDVDLVRLAIRRAEPHLPFVIESLDFRWNWRDLRSLSRWHVPSMDAVLRWDAFRVRLSGPLDFAREPSGSIGGLSARYAPRATIEPVRAPESRSKPVELELAARLGREMTEIEKLDVEASASVFDFRFLSGVVPELGGLELSKGASVSASWSKLEGKSPNLARAVARLPEVIANVSPERMVRLEDLRVSGSTLLSLQPPSVGTAIPFRIEARTAEALWDELYLDLPLGSLPVEGQLEPKPRDSAFRGEARIGPPKAGGLTIAATALARDAGWKLDWSAESLSIQDLVRAALKATEASGGPAKSLAFLRDWEIRQGTIATRGSVRTADLAAGFLPEATLRIRKLAWSWPAARMAFAGVDLDATTRPRAVSAPGAATATVSAEAVRLRKLRARLEPTLVHLGGGALSLGAEGLGLEVEDAEGMSLKVPRARARLGGEEPRIDAAMSLAGATLETIARKLCLTRGPVPPVKIKASFPSIEIEGGDVELPDGRVTAEAFGGVLVAEELSAYDLGTEVPELDFTLDFGGLRLDLFGEWAGFGEMDGVLAGHAREVVFQSWLPTQFDFRLEARPHSRGKIVFSPDAMRNLVRLFAGEDIGHIPGVANWLAFGWPSRVFGGYDVRYAGVSLFSKDGSILLETLDPPDVVKSEGGKRFFLYGPRFKMPLNSSRYPLVVDAPAMANFVRQMLGQLRALAEQKSQEKSQEKPKEKNDAPAEPRDEDPLSDPECTPRA